MGRMGIPSWRKVVMLLTGAAVLMACAAESAGSKPKKKSPVDPGDEFWEDEAPLEQDPITPTINEDSGAFGASERPKSTKDASVDATVPDSGPPPKVFCQGPLAAGDLAVVEIMINSRAGGNDEGEWVEIQNRRDCWLTLSNVTVDSPRGAAPTNVAAVPAGLELGPGATFVVAGSADPAKNHDIPGTVVAWAAIDVLKNDGDTINVKAGTTTLDSVTYPAFSNLGAGRTLAFPSDCTAPDRADWKRWSLTFDEFATGFKGTPNAPNDDVACF